MPARSPMPLIVPWIHVAPARTAATAVAVASPKSLWPWKWTGTSARPPRLSGRRARRPLRATRCRACRRRRPRSRPPRPRGVHALVEVRLGARRVDAEERRVDAVLGGEAHRVRDPAEHLVAVDADRVELEVGDRRLDHGRGHAELDERLEVGRHGAREAPHLGAQPGAGDELDRVPVVLRDAREARLDPLDPELVEQPRDLELLLRVEHDADGLLAVAQRRVVEPDVAADAGSRR